MMKKEILLIIFGLSIVTFTDAFAQTTDNPRVITKEITYFVGINSLQKICGDESSAYDIDGFFDLENLSPDYRPAFLQKLFDLAYADRLELLNSDNMKITGAELKEALTIYDTVHVDYFYPPYDRPDTVIADVFYPGSVTFLCFREEWTYLPSTMEIIKRVLAFAPSVEVFDENKGEYSGKKILFWVNLDQQTPGGQEKLLSQRIVYRTGFLPSTENNCTGNTDTAHCAQYIKKLIERAGKGELNLYDPNSSDFPPLAPLSPQDFYNRFTRTDTLSLMSPDPPFDYIDSVVKTELKPGEISTLKFVEEWTIDPDNMYFFKKVIGIAPSQEVSGVLDEFIGYRPLFYLYFNDIWRPFDDKVIIKK